MTPFLDMAIDTVARNQGDQALCWHGGPTRSNLDLQVIDVGPFRAKEGILSTSLKASLEPPSPQHPMTDLSDVRQAIGA